MNDKNDHILDEQILIDGSQWEVDVNSLHEQLLIARTESQLWKNLAYALVGSWITFAIICFLINWFS